MSSRNPKEIETTDREEMMCPECWTKGLEPHPGYVEEYDSQKARIIKATKCPNPDCPYSSRVPPGEIQMQYKEPGLLMKIIQGLFGGDSVDNKQKDKQRKTQTEEGGFITKTRLVIGLAFAGLLIYSLISGGGGGAIGELVDINGEVVGVSGENTLSNVSINEIRTGSSVDTTADGKFQLDIPKEKAILSFKQNKDNSVVKPHAVVLSYQNNTVDLINTPEEAISVDSNGNFSFNMPLESELNYTKFTTEGTLTIGSIHPDALSENITVDIMPRSGTVTQTRDINEGSNSVTVSGDLVSARGNIKIEPTNVKRKINGSASPEDPVVDLHIEGNTNPINPTLDIEGIETTSETIEREVTHRDTIQHEFSEENRVNIGLTLTGLADEETRETFGDMTQESPLFINIGEDSAPSDFNLEITGESSSEEVKEEGIIEDNAIRETLGGNLPPRNVTANFTGGLVPEDYIGSSTLRESAEFGESQTKKNVFEAQQNSLYRINLTQEGSPSDLWGAGYSINGERETLQNNTNILDVELNTGDKFSIWTKAERETLSVEKDFTLPDGYPLELVNVNSPSNVETGESFPLEATLKNPDNAIYEVNVYAFKDGNQEKVNKFEFRPQEEKTITVAQMSFATSGVHTVSVNEGEKQTVQVGGEELRYGEGSIEAEAQRLSTTGGTVRMDTTGNGKIDCVVTSTGSCDISDEIVQPGSNTFQAITEDVDEVSYQLEYVKRQGTKDLNIDMNNDGEVDFQHTGRLPDGETASASVQLEAGSYEISPSEPGKELKYEASWDRIGVVNNPKVLLNGETVVNDTSSFRGSRTYSIGDVPAGENTLEFRMDSEAIKAELKWDKEGVDAYPDVYSQGQVACLNQELAIEDSCSLEDIGEGEQSVEFRNLNQKINYSIDYDAVAIPQSVDVTINEGDTVSYTSNRPQNIEEWEQTISSTDLIQNGNNIIDIRPKRVDSIKPEVKGQIVYESEAIPPRNTEINVTDSTNQEIYSVDIPSRYNNNDNELAQEYTLEIPRNRMKPGNTHINIQTSNQGVLEIKTQFTGTTYTNINYQE